MKVLEMPKEAPVIGQPGPYVALFRDMVLSAHQMGASDIHVQPSRDGIDIRFRVNGDLGVWKKLGTEHRQSFLNEAKRVAGLAIAVSGRAQDGRVSFPNWRLDMRSSLLPSQYGEKLVLRLLDLSRRFEMVVLGLDDRATTDLKDALRAPSGVILISGPTGSGKTTTLYTLLCAIDRSRKNIVTLEDPIEYSIDGLTQVQITRKLSFSDALRAVLRQDPDVVLVGEIRDAETADLCVKAASTGHLVLSTLHANGAEEVVGRLLNLGVDRYLLGATLRFSGAQRLVKRLCPQCSVPVPDGVSKEIADDLKKQGIGAPNTSGFRARNPSGCDKCSAGVIGRSPILEYMTAPQITTYLAARPPTAPELTVSLTAAALRKAEKGEMDATEIVDLD